MIKNIKIIVNIVFLLVILRCSGDKIETSVEYWKNKSAKNGHIRYKYRLLNGELDGYCYRYYSNGQLMSKAIYEKDHLVKIVCVFDTLGRELNFGQLDENGTGYIITYSDVTGTREYSGYYKNGRREGWWKNYIYEGGSNDSIFFENSYSDFMPSIPIVMY